MFYDRFSEACARRGTTPSVVLQAAGKSASRGTEWKNSGKTPRESTIVELAEVLGCDPSELLDGPGGEEMGEADELPRPTRPRARMTSSWAKDINEADLLAVYRASTKLQRTKLMQRVYEFAESEGVDWQ